MRMITIGDGGFVVATAVFVFPVLVAALGAHHLHTVQFNSVQFSSIQLQF